LHAANLRLWAVLAVLTVGFVTAALRGPAAHAGSTPAQASSASLASSVRVSVGEPRPVILVVGDSLVYQARTELNALSDAHVEVRVAARLGTAPCDWAGGDFAQALHDARPSVVVLAFTGNTGAAPGCVSGGRAYPLAELLDNYRVHLADLADRATQAGATVVLSTPPARNPADPAPPAVPVAPAASKPMPFYGFQGVPQLRSLYADLVEASGGRWHLSNAAALAVSPNFVYSPTLPCESFDGACPTGTVAVRDGGSDAIHLDPQGHGAKRFARGLVGGALAALFPLTAE
jgi:hypothetical protein